ncbi:helix-turn-helix domain-containing protein [Rhizobium freirei]|uniref:helix-turn-helix domain-containing protein n=1 Tax=Rhizobium freirei TaxID=1353277 RepID=UPI0012F7EA50|nr:helix-turn-helix transcriptional regulator [Rhizobium freirei]
MDKKPDAIDVGVGSRNRLLREELSIMQSIVAEELCISPQQLEKYEYDVKKIGAGRLPRISESCDVPVMLSFGSASDDVLPSAEARLILDLLNIMMPPRRQPYWGLRTSGCGRGTTLSCNHPKLTTSADLAR